MSRKSFMIMSARWPGVRLIEEEASVALAGLPLPKRILSSTFVSSVVRERAKIDEEYQKFILEDGGIIAICRCDANGSRGPYETRTEVGGVYTDISVSIHRSIQRNDGGVIEGVFNLKVTGGNYSDKDIAILTEELEMAGRLIRRAREIEAANPPPVYDPVEA